MKQSDVVTAVDQHSVRVTNGRVLEKQQKLMRLRAHRERLLAAWPPFQKELTQLENELRATRQSFPASDYSLDRLLCALDSRRIPDIDYAKIEAFERRWNVFLRVFEQAGGLTTHVSDDEFDLGVYFLDEYLERTLLTAIRQRSRLLVVDLEGQAEETRKQLDAIFKGLGRNTFVTSRRKSKGRLRLDDTLEFWDLVLVKNGKGPADAAKEILSAYREGVGPKDRYEKRAAQILAAQRAGAKQNLDWTHFRTDVTRRWEAIKSALLSPTSQA